MGDKKTTLGSITQALLVGGTVGAVPLVTVGCAGFQFAPAQQAEPTQRVATTQDEKALCDRALETQDVNAVNQLIRTHPNSRCIAPLITALPVATRAAISPSVLRRMSRTVRNEIPAAIRAQLRFSDRETSDSY